MGICGSTNNKKTQNEKPSSYKTSYNLHQPTMNQYQNNNHVQNPSHQGFISNHAPQLKYPSGKSFLLKRAEM